MPIETQSSPRAARRIALASSGAAISLALGALLMTRFGTDVPVDREGYTTGAPRIQELDAIEAAFPRESYRPGTMARLRFWTAVAGTASIRVYRVGPETIPTVGDKVMEGVAVSHVIRRRGVRAGSSVELAIGDWPSGLYFAKVTDRHRTGFAPFVLAPGRFGAERVAVVLPTRTWQAYNFRDDDADGRGNSWYAKRGGHYARLGRPFLNRGVPPHFRRYDLPFLRWLHWSGKRVDVLSQADIDGVRGEALARAYSLLIFPGHHEYVTAGEYDAVQRYRDLGGNLLFLSANNFFWRIDLRGDQMRKIAQWRRLGRPEAALLGVQYGANDRGQARGPWIVRRTRASSWLFDGVELANGNEFSRGGIEIDTTTPASPRGIEIVAEIPKLLAGKSAQMTYYETRGGARVFSAGAFTLAGHVEERAVQKLLRNIWVRMAGEGS